MGFALSTVGLCAVLALGGCASEPEPAAEVDTRLARALHASAIRAAVAHPGVTVCRQLMVGIAERDWVRGQVVGVRESAVGVRIRDTGRFPHMVEKTLVEPGTVLWAAPIAWTPCV